MLKRQDLAKQFELIVQQEIKNHNSSILATNQAINEMKDQIQSLIKVLAQHTARNDAWFKKTQEEFLNLERSLSKDIQNNAVKIESLKKSCDASDKYIWQGIEKIEAEYIDQETFKEFKEEMKKEMADLYLKVQYQNDYQRAALYKIKTELDKTMKDFIDGVQNQPDHLWDVKEELEKKIEAAVIDSKGVLKELQVHKREAFVMEKKIENIYSLIEKLKKQHEVKS